MKQEVLPNEFIMNDDLRKVLEQISKYSPIAEEMLNLKTVEGFDRWMNFFGISKDNPNFFSYVDDKRYAAYKDTSETKCLNGLEIGDYLVLTEEEDRRWFEIFTEERCKPKIITEVDLSGNTCRIYRVTIPNERRCNPMWVDNNQIAEVLSKKSKLWEPKIRYHAPASKLIRRMFGKKFTEQQYSDFCSFFHNHHPDVSPLLKYKTAFVKGSEIQDWYHEEKYASTTHSLGNSCMRYSKCRPWLQIYADNPELIQLFIVTQDDKLVARCLVWNSQYFDRVYAINYDLEKAVIQHLTENDLEDVYNKDKVVTFEVEYGKDNYDRFPYMDTFRYLGDNKISTCDEEVDDNFELSRANGGYDGYDPDEDEDTIECEISGDSYPEEDTRFIPRYTYYVHCSYAVYSEWEGNYILDSESVWSDRIGSYLWGDRTYCDYRGDYIPRTDSVRLENGEYAHEDDEDIVEIHNEYYVNTDDRVIEINGEYYLKEDLVLVDGEYHLEEDLVYSKYLGKHLLKTEAEFRDDDWFPIVIEDPSQLKLEFA